LTLLTWLLLGRQRARLRGTGTNGVPVGVQIDTPVMIASGCPSESTRSAPTSHWPVTHGPLPPGVTNAQPATT
jgi:hypothetical protein